MHNFTFQLFAAYLLQCNEIVFGANSAYPDKIWNLAPMPFKTADFREQNKVINIIYVYRLIVYLKSIYENLILFRNGHSKSQQCCLNSGAIQFAVITTNGYPISNVDEIRKYKSFRTFNSWYWDMAIAKDMLPANWKVPLVRPDQCRVAW